MALIRATPPPGTIPSSMAARVAERASSTRCFFSFSSTSVAAPTLTTATPPEQLGQALLQLLAVVVGGRLVHLGLDLAHAVLDRLVGAVALDDRGLVLVGRHAAGPAKIVDGGRLELAAELLGDDGAPGEHGDVPQHLLAPVAKARGLDGQHVEGAAQLVDDQGGQGLAVHVLGDDAPGPSCPSGASPPAAAGYRRWRRSSCR